MLTTLSLAGGTDPRWSCSRYVSQHAHAERRDTRRVKQATAEWYVLQMLELSWDGFCTHTEQGWNIGKPCNGYLAGKIPHLVPAKRAECRTKTRLLPRSGPRAGGDPDLPPLGDGPARL
jgi:hypothetical protein